MNLESAIQSWTHPSFEFSVSQPYSFLTVIELHYIEPWAGEQYDEVSDTKDTYEIHYDAATAEFTAYLPSACYPRQSAPLPTTETEPPATQQYDTFSSLETALFETSTVGQPLCDWLADFIERDRFDRFSDACPGVGPKTAQSLYEKYGSLNALHNTPFEELDNEMWTRSATVFAESTPV